MSLVLLLVLLGSLVGCLKQASIYFYTNRRLAQKERELKQLEEKNRALKIRLEEVEKPEFLDEQARKLLGMGDASRGASIRPTTAPETKTVTKEVKSELPNFQKWWQLFVYPAPQYPAR